VSIGSLRDNSSESAEGLPIGVQIAGRRFVEELVLAVAAEVEAEFGYLPPEIAWK
jgi:Asp-tRNA(Asn)/Glu-tRNA(Gln) amidotransferase A subunit family amidase